MLEPSGNPEVFEDNFELASDVLADIEADINIDIDIEVPDALNFQPAQWLDDRYDVVRGDGTIYEGHIRNRKKHGEGILYDETRTQYVNGYWYNDKLVNVYFAQFILPNESEDLLRIYGWDDLITSNRHNFVARINKKPLELECIHFPSIRRDIQSKITINKILDDDLRNLLNSHREKFQEILSSRKDDVTHLRSAQRDMFHLFLIMTEINEMYCYEENTENINLLTKIYTNQFISDELKNGAKNCCTFEQTVFSRNKKLPIMKLKDFQFSWKNVIFSNVKESVIIIKKAIISSLPSRVFIHTGPEDINSLQDRQLFTCSVYDIHLFKDLELTAQRSKSKFDFTRNYIYKLWQLTIQQINKTVLYDIPDDSVYTNTVFLQLFKTFLELLDCISRQNDLKVKDLLTVKNNIDLEYLEVVGEILDLSKERLVFIIKLMNHFKPGEVKNYKFSYAIDYFEIQVEQNVIYATINSVANYIRRAFDNSLTNIQNEKVIWLYYIHFCFSKLNRTENNKNELNTFLNSLMDLFKTVIKNNSVSFEKIRILSDSIIKFGITICPYFQDSIFDGDMEILSKQADFIKDFVTSNEHCLDEITNIVDIYQVFWDERQNLINDLNLKIPKPFCIRLMSNFNAFINFIFDSRILTNKFLIFLRSFNEFIRLLRGTNFPWYVKNISSEFVEIVDKENNSYKVTDLENFLAENNSPPKHYLIETAIYFVKCTENFLINCRWDDKISAASDLLLLMGRSLINFEKLPNSVDFDKFFSVFTEPFQRVTDYSTDFSDFKRRLGSLENYYKYTIELNVMGIEMALDSCKKLNSNILSNGFLPNRLNYQFEYGLLQESFDVYLDKFNKYVDKYLTQNNFKIQTLVDHVKKKSKHVDFKKWDNEFKTLKLPKLLAGISAVWSALESKDVICQKQVIKPHVIQILCILRLLGVDQSKNSFDSHLAQVLTGQGKSIILGLLSAILALTGNRVRVVCYNKYLADRDKESFNKFFKLFNIDDDINYGTFDNMANEILQPKFRGVDYNLRKFVRELVTGELPKLFVREEDSVWRTILVIDEVDVFFTGEFHGNTYNACVTIGCEGIADVQLKIWNLTSSNCNESDLRESLQKYIDDIYPESTDPVFINLVKNSKTFLNKHVEEMISNAVTVRNSIPGDWEDKKFKLDKNDDIIVIENGVYESSTYYRYKNVFMYFKLKKNDYKHNNFENYGYLNVNCGSISYAMLPKDYQAILGVTGTLRQLSEVEMRAVASYGISRGSVMPTFFGTNKLRVINFTIKTSEDAWTTAILDSILSVIEKGRAVIVFFDTEFTIKKIEEKFASHLSRYSILTGNESKEEVANCVQEAGVARKVTISTRRMGRGVDFQSNDSAVEINGGVHVIQTFFSADIKEETQLKGRTARMDHSGTYELILCREHLSDDGYSDSLTSYEELNSSRLEKAQEKGSELEKKIEMSERKHDCTMKFLKSFYNYNTANRNEYFQKYPFIDIE